MNGASAEQPGKVLHVIAMLLPRTETFIREQLVGAAFRPQVLAWKRDPEGLAVDTPACFLRLSPPFRGDPKVRLGLRDRLKLPLCFLEVVKQIRFIDPDVVHVHFGPTALVVERACRWLGVPMVVSIYGFDAMPSMAPLYGRVFATAAKVIVEGPHLGTTLVGLGARPESIALLPLRLPEWAEREPCGRADPQARVLQLLQVGRFVPKKGIAVSLRALALARQAGADVALTILGDGPLAGEVRALIAELGIGDIVTLRGFVPHEEIRGALAQAHAVLQPSQVGPDGDTEGGAPTVLIEAQAQGVPIIASTHADIPFVVADGVTGLLSPEGDHAALAESIVRLSRDRGLLARLAAAARPHVLARHGRAATLATREDIYRQAIAAPARHGGLVRGLVRRLLRKRRPAPMSPSEYWEWRAKKLGARAVLHLGHDDVDELTRRQQGLLFPLLRQELRGDEKLVLDIGCGPGRFTAGLAELIGGRAIGLDTIQRLLDLAPRSPVVDYRRMGEGELPVESASADVVWVCLVLGCIVEDDTLVRTLAEIDRALAPGGLLFLVESTDEGNQGAHYRFRSFATYRELLPFVELRHLADYDNLGQRISVMAGRRVPVAAAHSPQPMQQVR